MVTSTDRMAISSTTTPHKGNIINTCKGANNNSTKFAIPTSTPRPSRRKGESPDSAELGEVEEELRLLGAVHHSALENIERQNKTIKLKDHELDEVKRKLDNALNENTNL